MATSLAYVVGLAGVVAGGLLLRDGDTTSAVVVWVLTFAGGAALMIFAMLLRGVGAVLARLAALESDVRVLLHDRRADEPAPDPWRHRPPY